MILNKWMTKWLGSRRISDDCRQSVVSGMVAAGFSDVPVDQEQLATKVANKLLEKHRPATAPERVASVVAPGDVCPRCGSPMREVLVGENKCAYCTNRSCRVVAHME
jgi:hypothetical protein